LIFNSDFSIQNLLELDKSVPNKPLTADEINRLPIEKFRRRPNQPDEDNKCNICWDEFEQNQSLRRLQCLHLYHKDCIDPWLKVSRLKQNKKVILFTNKISNLDQ
jgi:E3 ubiquitin-protein ligase RNF115/126